MNCLQGISETDYGPIFITVNPVTQPKAVQGQWYLEHPVYTAASVKGQELLPKIQNKRGIVFAGAWTKYGFHEDAFSSGIQAANLIDPELGTKCLNAVQLEDPQSVRGIGYYLRFIVNVIQQGLNIWDDIINVKKR
jgi:predicted NAD/FAD-binding protein